MNDVLYGFDYLEYYIFLIYCQFIGYPLVIRICIVVVVVFFLGYFMLSFYLLWGVIRRKKEKKTTQDVYNQYYDLVVEIALSDDRKKLDQIIKSLKIQKRGKKKESNKRLQEIALMLSYIKMKFNGQINKTNFQTIQTAFGISRFFEQELMFGRKSHKILALKLIQSLESYVGEAVLVRFLYHRNIELRTSARYVYMWLSQNDPFRFFEEDITMNLRQWDMIEMHDTINHRLANNLVMPNLSKWVSESTKEDVKIFFINEIRYFEVYDSCKVLQKLLNAPSWKLRNEIITTLGTLKYQGVEETLIKMYDLQPELIKQTIVKSVSLIHSGNAVPFLKAAYETAETQTTKLLALDGLYNYSESGIIAFEALRLKAKNEHQAILFEHVENPLINN